MFRGDLAAGGPKAGVGCGGVAEQCQLQGCKVAMLLGGRGGLVIAGGMGVPAISLA